MKEKSPFSVLQLPLMVINLCFRDPQIIMHYGDRDRGVGASFFRIIPQGWSYGVFGDGKD